MPMDEYDYVPHSNVFNSIINIYKNDNLDDKINQFIVEKNISYGKKELIQEIKRNVTNIRNSWDVLENRHITCIGARICYYDKEYDMESNTCNYKPKWYLLNVWRGVQYTNTTVIDI
jgi:hypothetical protein